MVAPPPTGLSGMNLCMIFYLRSDKIISEVSPNSQVLNGVRGWVTPSAVHFGGYQYMEREDGQVEVDGHGAVLRAVLFMILVCVCGGD